MQGSSHSVLKKPYIIYMCILQSMEIHEIDIISINKTTAKESKPTKTKAFCSGEKNQFECLHKELF